MSATNSRDSIGGSSVARSWQSSSSGSKHPIGGLLKCKHKTPVVYETCRKEHNYGRKFFGCKFWKANRGCGFFVWEDELEKYLIETNSMLEERTEQPVLEVSRLQTEIHQLRNGSHSNLKSEEEVSKLKGKLDNEKNKRKAREEEVMCLKEEMLNLKAQRVYKFSWLNVIMCVILGVWVVVNSWG